MDNILLRDLVNEIDENTKVISDTHFSHKNILNFEPCRLTQMRIDGYDADEHDKWLIDKWNENVGKDELVIHLGDFAFKRVAECLEELNGRIILILGNHDGNSKNTKYNKATVVDGSYMFLKSYTDDTILCKIVDEDEKNSSLIIEIGGKTVMFCHYALFNKNGEWDYKNPKIAPRIKYLESIYSMLDCDVNVHGHLHSSISTFDKSINCSLEHIEFKPTKIKDLKGW